MSGGPAVPPGELVADVNCDHGCTGAERGDRTCSRPRERNCCGIDDASPKSQEIGKPKQDVLTFKPYCLQALLRLFGIKTMQVMQGSDLGWLLVIVAVAAFLAGLFGERLRASWHVKHGIREGALETR